MVSLTASVDGVASAAFAEALKMLGESLGDASAQAPRRAAIQLCKNFRANTRQAKKNKAMVVAVSETNPKYITYRNGQKLDRPLRRWRVTLVDRGKTFDRYVYATDRADMRRQLREQVGTNYFPIGDKGTPQKKGGTRGLAKKSWGWVMHNIFSGAAPDTPWKRRKNDRRNPKDATKESTYRASNGIATSGGFARICNRLSYIRDALKISEDAAIAKASSAIVRTLVTKRLKGSGMSSAEIRAAAASVADEFKRQFPPV